MTEPDPRRWLALGSLLLALLLVVLGNTVLNVAIPTMVRELDTDLPTIQWVVAGYSLVFASLLVIGGRLGDVYGARRMFVLGALLFGVGSAFGAAAPNVGVLVLGEAGIKGTGAALMMPASLSLVSNMFRGVERATAFAAWGAVLGAGMAFGPVVGGYFTTYHSWRWAFGINVILAPICAAGALLLVRADVHSDVRPRVDLLGAALAAAGTFSLVFAISQGRRYGVSDWRILATATTAVVALTMFVVVERGKERAGAEALFEFSQLRHLRFRYGLIAQLVLATGQMGQFFVLPIFLQNAKGLEPIENGLWMLPMGISILVFAQVGGRLARVMGTTTLVRVGLVLNTLGLVLMAVLLRPDVTFGSLLPAFAVFGMGVGLATSQLTNVILADVDVDKAGTASGANSTVRQVGSALGVALMGAVLAGNADIASAGRVAMFIAAGILAVGAGLAFLIPSDRESRDEVFAVADPVDTGLLG